MSTEHTENQGVQAGPRFQFTSEEIRVLNECRSESFYYRCVPLSAALMVTTHAAVTLGYLKPNPRWGSIPKCAAAMCFGYLAGKLSYQKQCEAKFINLPDSKIGEAIRRKRGMHTEDRSLNQPQFATSEPSQTFSKRNLDMDFDRSPQVQGLDDSFRPSLDTPEGAKTDEEQAKAPSYTTYEELRRKNWDEFEKKRPQHSQQSGPQINITYAPESVPLQKQSEAPQRNPTGPKNKYGDAWEQ